MGGERGPQVQLKGSGMCALFGKPYQDVYLSFVSGLLDFSLTWVFDNIDNIAQVLTVFEPVNFVFTIYHVFFYLVLLMENIAQVLSLSLSSKI